LRGLFSGGTIAHEVFLGLRSFIWPITGNVATRRPGSHDEEKPPDKAAHRILDLGDDAYTQGRLHPMIDHDLRLRLLRQAAAEPDIGLILLDVVLGDGAHPDPAAEIAPTIAEVKRKRDIPIVAIVIGTAADPQGLDRQVEHLQDAGAIVFRDIIEAVEFIVLSGEQAFGAEKEPARPGRRVGMDLSPAAFREPVSAINVGLESFTESLLAQGVTAVQVDWRPPAGGNPEFLDILAKMKPKGS
jgi:FdrA protein